MSTLVDVRQAEFSVEDRQKLSGLLPGMTPLFIGDRRRLLTSFHRPDSAASSGRAVLLCNPFGQEALRAHRLYRVLAERLVRAGIHVLRFDYYGTGDSYGNDEEGELVGWRNDIQAAHRALLLGAGVRQASWVGVRLGATLAMQAAEGMGEEVQQLILVDPIIDGAAYSRSLRAHHVARLEAVFRAPNQRWREALAANPNAFENEASGFGLATNFHQQLADISPDRLKSAAASRRITVIMDSTDPTLTAWRTTVADDPRVEWISVDHGYDWSAHEAVDGILVPAMLLRDIVKSLGV